MLAVSELTTIALVLAIIGLLMTVCVLSSRSLERLGVPAMLVFLVLGMLAGSQGLGGIEFEDYRLAFRLGTAALVLILFDGGLNTPLASLKESVWPASVLATLGVLGTAGLVALFCRLVGMGWRESLLLGAVVSSTDAAAVFGVLRGGNLNLARRVGTTIELESGINDPMAVILTLAVTEALIGQQPDLWMAAAEVGLQLLIGLGMGVGLGLLARTMLKRIRLSTAGFYPVLTVSLAFLAFGLATLVHGSGFLAVYTVAVVIGNGRLPYHTGLTRIHDAIAWLSQITMFLTLGLLVFPTQLWAVAGVGLAVSLFLACVARPLIVLLCLLPFRYPMGEIIYIGWVGLRGAVPIILASFPVLAGVEGAGKVFNIVFFVVVLSSLVPGATIRYATRRLGLQGPENPTPLAALEINSTRLLNGELMSFFIRDELAVCNVPLSRIPFPPQSSAVLLVRGEELIAPRGSTVLRPGDHAYIFCRSEDRPFLQFLFGQAQEHA